MMIVPVHPSIIRTFPVEAVENASDDRTRQRGRVTIRRILGQQWSRCDLVGKDVDFEIGLQYGHFDVEWSNLISEALRRNQHHN